MKIKIIKSPYNNARKWGHDDGGFLDNNLFPNGGNIVSKQLIPIYNEENIARRLDNNNPVRINSDGELQDQITGEKSPFMLNELTVRPVPYISAFDKDPLSIGKLTHNTLAVANAMNPLNNVHINPEIIYFDNPVRVMDDNTGALKNILTNDFVENNANNIRVAKDFKNTKDTLIGDNKIPLSNMPYFYGIQDGNLKIGHINDFNDETTVVPVRNRTGLVTRIIKDNAAQKQVQSLSERLDNAKPQWLKNLYNKYEQINNREDKTRFLYNIYYPQYNKWINSNSEAKQISDKLNNLQDKYGKASPYTFYDQNNNIIENRFDKASVGKMLFITKDGKGSFMLSNPQKALRDPKLLNQINNAIKNGAYPVMVDNGRYMKYITNNPSYEEYTAGDFVRNPESMFVLGNRKKAFGGELGTNSADFTSGLTEVNEGGTHEQNPNDGVQMGTDQEGTPNLVEQGETVFNDYVFSNRLKVPDKVAQILKIKKGMTYADASKYLNKEVNERPNDPLSKGAQESLLSQLAMAQEMQRNAESKNRNSSNTTTNQHADGGNLFETGGDKVKPTTGNTHAFDYYLNTGIHQPVSERVKKGWPTFLGPNGEWLYNPDTGMYADEYLDPGFINYVKNSPKEIFNYFNPVNTPGYFKAGNTSAPTIDQLIGTISNPGLMYDRKYGEAHNFGAYMLAKYLAQKNKNNTKKQDKQQASNWVPPVLDTRMRYAPVVGSLLNVIAGLGQRPDYSNADLVANTNISPALVGANHIGNYLSYNPFDTQYYINQAQASNRATQRAIQNNSNGNRAMANAALLANDYNLGNNLGNLARQAAESNFAQRTQVEGFNRATNQYNADADTRAALANQAAINQARQLGLNRALQVANLRQQARDQYNNIAGANMTRLFQGLGDIGWENFNMNMINSNRALRYGTQTNGVSQYKGSSTKSRGGRLMK